MGIVDEDIATVRSSTDIVAIISQYTQLKRSGRRWVGLCPFHTEKTASFSVNQELGVYRCFGCQASGDAITFVREVEHLDFAAAVEHLAAKAGVVLRYTDRDEGASRKRRARLVEANAKAVDWYHDRLLSAPDAAAARRYLRGRGLTGDEVREFRLGWAPEGWDDLCRALRLPADVLVDAGLAKRNSRGNLMDTFRARILFPIHDANGDAVAFGGRIMPGATGPKYLNTPETSLYKKSKVLYALDRSKARIVSDDRAIVCEGYTDVMGFARIGLPAAVAPCGTALTDEHVRLLRRYARRLVLAFDADAAGQSAAERFYQWERDHELEVAVAALPPGVDPGDLAVKDPDALQAAVEGAVPFLRFRVDRALAAGDLSTAEGRARAAEAALEVIREHPSEMVRDPYVMTVADHCRLDPDQLRSALRAPSPARAREDRSHARAGRGPGRGEARGGDDGDPGPGGAWAASTAETATTARRQRGGPAFEVLRHVVHSWEALEGWVHAELFGDPLHVAAFEELMAHPTVPEAIDAATPEVADLLTELATDDSDSEPFDALARLVEQAARRELSVLRARISEHPDDVPALQRSADLTRAVGELRDPSTAAASVETLVAWLGRKGEEGE
jgi:DNA primase